MPETVGALAARADGSGAGGLAASPAHPASPKTSSSETTPALIGIISRE
jgi:hypothetical protein